MLTLNLLNNAFEISYFHARIEEIGGGGVIFTLLNFYTKVNKRLISFGSSLLH